MLCTARALRREFSRSLPAAKSPNFSNDPRSLSRVPRVRIPPSPPVCISKLLFLAFAALAACQGHTVGEAAPDAAGGAAGSDAGPDAAPDADGDADTGTGGQSTVEVLATGRDCPIDLRVVGGSLIWVDQGSLQNGSTDGVVATMPADGCGDDAGACATALATNQQSPTAVEVDPLTNTVYWGTLGDGTIWQLSQPANNPIAIAPGQSWPRWLAIDDVALYWTNNGAGEIRRQYLAGGTVGGLPIVQALEFPVAIVVSGQRIYFTNDGDSDTTGYVTAADLIGTNPTPIAANQSHPHGIAVDTNYVYWANGGDGSIERARADGSELERIYSDRPTPWDVAVDGKALYWVEAGTPNGFTDGAVMAAKLDGSEIVTLADGQLDPRRLVLDGDWVYFIDRGTQGLSPCSQHDGAILRVKKPW
jgi:Domain of unknown function (DUF5050)